MPAETPTLTPTTPTPTGTVQVSGPIPGATPVRGDIDSAINEGIKTQAREPIQTEDTEEPIALDNNQPNADNEDIDGDDYLNSILKDRTIPKSPKKEPAASKPVVTPDPTKPIPEVKVEPTKDKAKDGKVNIADLIFKKDATIPAPTPTAIKQPIVRNYDGLPPEHVEAFKNMSKEAYAAVRPIYDEHKIIKSELETLRKNPPTTPNPNALPDSYLQHEEAYVLLPEYKHSLQEVDRLDWEVGYWQKQMALIEAGDNWTPLKGYDEKTGKYYPDQQYKADGAAKAHVMAAMQRAINQKDQREGVVQQIVGMHQQVHKQALGQLKAIEEQFFPFYKDDATNPHKEMIDASYAKMPAIMRSSPFAPFIAKGTAFVRALEDKIQELVTENATLRASSQKQEIAKAGPTATVSASSTNTQAAANEVSYDKFKEMIGR